MRAVLITESGDQYKGRIRILNKELVLLVWLLSPLIAIQTASLFKF